MDYIVAIFRNIFGMNPRHVPLTNPAEKLLSGMTITSKCRYNASIRIKRLSQFSFYTTTVLSLGLILIPLLQNASIQLVYPDRVLNMLQIFLAVAVLVYSVINATARYETRAEKLNECGDRIKELIRELRVDIASSRARIDPTKMASYNERYTDVSTDSENHTRADYSFAVIRTPEYYAITGIPRLLLVLKSYIQNFIPYAIPVSMITLEIFFIFDMLGVTHVITPFIHPVTGKS